MAVEPEHALLAQTKLDHNVTRIDQELARTMQQYDDAREQRAGHFRKMKKAEAGLVTEVEQLRKKLEPIVFGKKAPGAGFAADCQRYTELVGQLATTRQARSMSWPATQKPELPPIPGEQPEPAGKAKPAPAT